MEWLIANQTAIWLALGFCLLIMELAVFGLSAGGVLLFAGLGALLTGLMMASGMIPENFLFAAGCFTITTTLVTALLWKPFKRLQSGSELGRDRSSDLIGHTFVLNQDINLTTHAQQRYSGIAWRVEPDTELPAPTIKAGTQVEVTAVNAGVFFVKPTAKSIL